MLQTWNIPFPYDLHSSQPPSENNAMAGFQNYYQQEQKWKENTSW